MSRTASPPTRHRRAAALAGSALLAATALTVSSLSGTAAAQVDNGRAAAAKVDNPYAGAKVYVNPDWSAKAAAESGGSKISNQPTGIWLDRIAAINGTGGARGLRAHLDTALTQSGGSPMVVQLVVYDLPGRDCSALASNGELGPTEIDKYKTQFIDPIASILSESKYANSNLRIVATVEIDSLPNLITNTGGRPTATPQ
ncbi:glycoside hydrolase family 6 protein, partial [Streptomyces sp. MCAF7]